MLPLDDLKNIRIFLKQLIEKEVGLKEQLTQKLFMYCPLDVAKNIIGKIEKGEDSSSLVSAFLLWEKNQKINYGTVKWLD